MKKLLLSFFATGLVALSIEAQSCTPGANFVDSTYGVWPDTIQNFPPAAANVAYSTDLNFKVPATVTAELDASGQFVGSPIQSFTVTGVQGLPTGYNYACNIANCTYAGGANGCANVYGTTATTGTYPTPVTQSVSFGGYKIIVGNAGLITSVIEPLNVFPNPANGQIVVKGILANTLTISNLNGQIIVSKSAQGLTQMTLDINSLQAGVYFINAIGEQGIETIRLIKD
jgi:Secretion system C-terminal sorting domain